MGGLRKTAPLQGLYDGEMSHQHENHSMFFSTCSSVYFGVGAGKVWVSFLACIHTSAVAFPAISVLTEECPR